MRLCVWVCKHNKLATIDLHSPTWREASKYVQFDKRTETIFTNVFLVKELYVESLFSDDFHLFYFLRCQQAIWIVMHMRLWSRNE